MSGILCLVSFPLSLMSLANLRGTTEESGRGPVWGDPDLGGRSNVDVFPIENGDLQIMECLGMMYGCKPMSCASIFGEMFIACPARPTWVVFSRWLQNPGGWWLRSEVAIYLAKEWANPIWDQL